MCSFMVFFTWTHGLVAKARSSDYGDMGSIPVGCWNPLQPLCHFALYWACQWTDTFCIFLNVASGNLAETAFYFLIWASDFHCLGALEWLWFYSQKLLNFWFTNDSLPLNLFQFLVFGNRLDSNDKLAKFF